MVAMVLYNPPIPTRDPVTARMFLPCRMIRVTIMRVRRVLSETEIERCGRMKLTLPHPQEWEASTAMPVAISTTLAQSTAARLGRTRIHTHGGKVHEAGERGDPEVLAVDDVTTVKLDKPALDASVGGCRTKRKTNQKAVGQPIAQESR